MFILLGFCHRIRRRPVRNSKQRLKITRGDEEIAEKENKLEKRTVNRIQPLGLEIIVAIFFICRTCFITILDEE
jgi:hypothetical protein